MSSGLTRTLRFARAWGNGAPRLEVEEILLPGRDAPLHATRYRPAGIRSGPGWILLHGMTRTGRRHVNLVRFARSIAGSGATVVVPEVPEWVDLRLAPHRTVPAVEAALAALEEDPGVRGGPGLMGFSFGGPQALRAAVDPALAGRLSCVAAFGGYGELDRTLEFLLFGTHEWEGRTHRIRPDPYGRWIVAANYLTRVPGFEDAEPVARALWELAAYAGDEFIESVDPRLDERKDRLEEELPGEWRELFRLFAPPVEHDPPPSSPSAQAWTGRLARAGAEADPLLELPELLELPVPAFLVHGRNDHLIPFSETLRLAQRIRAPRFGVTLTGLFAHSTGDPRPHGVVGWTREVLRLGGALREILETPGSR